uniref:Uncharacterized protein n=1 Tax=Rhizophora mucronata TaxID=61149 RepID=A0A2P2K4M3_RHIMU
MTVAATKAMYPQEHPSTQCLHHYPTLLLQRS